MKLFTVGPVQTYPEVTEVYRQEIPYFRTTEFGNLVKNNMHRLAALLGMESAQNLIYFTSSGTGAMEAVVQSCFAEKDKVLVINGGSFGHRFCELCAWHHIPYDSLDLNWNQALTADLLVPYERGGYTALLVNLHETSTGQLYDIEMLSSFCRRNNMYLVVDAISTFLADDYNMDQHHIDVTIFSSQKGLCLSAGLAFVALSSRMRQRVEQLGKKASYYFNFADSFHNIERGQTPFTPAVCIMYELSKLLDLVEAIGKEAWLNNIAEKCRYFRKKAAECGLSVPDAYPLSHMLTPIQIDSVNAYEVFRYLQEHFRIFVNPCGGELASRLLRISHIGNTTLDDIDDLLEKICLSIQVLGRETGCAALG